MNLSPGEPVVQHNRVDSRFELRADGLLAVADYALANGRMTLMHTFVPPEWRGRGVAEKLVRAALGHAQTEGLRVVPACSYVASFIERHAEFQSLVA